MRVLCVEDEAPLREDMAEYLRLKSYDVDEAACGHSALERLERHQYDIVLCDIKMPRMDGFELLRQVRSENRMTAMPFIFLSALNDKDNRYTAHQTGCDGFLTKPIDFSLLDITLKSHVERQRVRDFMHLMQHDSLRSHVSAMIDDALGGGLREASDSIHHLRETLPVLTPTRLDDHLSRLQREVSQHAMLLYMLRSALQEPAIEIECVGGSMCVDELFASAVAECRYFHPESPITFDPYRMPQSHYVFGDIDRIRRALAALLGAARPVDAARVLHYTALEESSILSIADHPDLVADDAAFTIMDVHTDLAVTSPVTRARLIPLLFASQVARVHGGHLALRIGEGEQLAVRMMLPDSTAAGWLERRAFDS